MEAKIGDRVSIDAKKVGQPRRTGVIAKVNKGLSGIRYQVRWDDGHESVLSPGAGNLCVEASGNAKRASGNGRRPKAKSKSKPKAKPRAARKKPARRR